MKKTARAGLNFRTIQCALVLFAILGFVSADPIGASSADDLDERLDIELIGASAEDVFKSMAQILGDLELDLDPEVADRDVTISVRQVSIRTTLTAICESISCRWYLGTGGAGRLGVVDAGERAELDLSHEAQLQERVSLELKGAGFVDVAKAMGNILEVPIHVDEPLTEQSVSISLHETRLEVILDRLCSMAGCRWELVEGEDSAPILVFYPTN